MLLTPCRDAVPVARVVGRPELVLVDRNATGAEVRPGVKVTTRILHIDENRHLVMEPQRSAADRPGEPTMLVWRKR